MVTLKRVTLPLVQSVGLGVGFEVREDFGEGSAAVAAAVVGKDFSDIGVTLLLNYGSVRYNCAHPEIAYGTEYRTPASDSVDRSRLPWQLA
jgi:hypothetical protein